MIRLFNSMEHPGQWIAGLPDGGWVAFPKAEGGWELRRPVHGLDPIHLREVPSAWAAAAGLKAAAPPKFKRVA
ncbi:MAG TPA: hypothetical protein VKT49_07135 [Bryobacteraceae bacterium]|nr:hypothetical protein [Bryobacteraceae bacterium]